MIKRAPQVRIAGATAAQVLMDRGIEHLPVDPFAIAAACDIHVEAKPPQYDGFSGMLARVGETFGILYATYVPSKGFQRFSVAHELGHYFLPGHVDQVLGGGPHVSRANFASADPCEVEADMFAASLLMPPTAFKRAMGDYDDGLDAVIGLAGLCETSLTATAVSYARQTRSAVAVIQSTAGVVDFCLLSDALKGQPSMWLRRGDPVPTGTLTQGFAAERANIDHARRDAGDVTLSDWFERADRVRAQEEVIGLGRFGKALTLLHCPKLSLTSDGYEDDEDDEDDLVARWTPTFGKR